MKKWMALLLCTAMLLAITAGCVQTPDETQTSATASTETSTDVVESSAAPAPELTITYQSISATDMFITCFAEYQKSHPNLKLDVITKDASTVATDIMAQVQTNTVPDVTWNNMAQTVGLVNSYPDVFLDLTDIINTRFAGRFNSGTFNLGTTEDGRIVNFPGAAGEQGWLVNKALFEQYNVKIPTTFDEMITAAQVFRANGLTLIGNGTGDAWANWGWHQWMSCWGIEDQTDALFKDGTLKVEDADFSQAFYKMIELYEAGAFPDNNSTITYEQTKALLLNQQCAMITTSADWLTGITGSDLDMNGDLAYVYGIVFPDAAALGHDQNIVPKACGNGYALSASMPQEKLDALLDFFDWLYSDEGANLVIPTGEVLPIQFNLTAEVTPLVQSIVELSNDTSRRGMLTAVYSFYLTWGQNWDICSPVFYSIDGIVNGCINGTVTAADVPALCAECDELIQVAIQEYNSLPQD